jgi:hypothetical protein
MYFVDMCAGLVLLALSGLCVTFIYILLTCGCAGLS